MKSKTIKGILSLSLAQLAVKAMTLLLMLYLAKILSPKEFSLIGVALVVIGFFDLMAELGLGSAIVQWQHLTDEIIDRIFWITIITGSVLSIISFFCSSYIELFFQKNGTAQIVRVLSPIMFINALYAVPYRLIVRKQLFSMKARIDLLAKGVSTVFSFLLAFWGYGVWALVYPQLLNSVVKMILSYWKTSYFPRKLIWAEDWKEIVAFGVRIVGLRATWYLRSQSDKVICGRYFEAVEFGYYTFAFQLARSVQDVIQGVLSTVSLPLLASKQSDNAAFNRAFLDLVKYTQLVAFPIFIGGIMLGKDLLSVISETKWVNATGIFQVACVVALLRIINSNAEDVFIALKKPHYSIRMNITSILVLSCAFYVGTGYGLIGVSIAWLSVLPIIVGGWVFFTTRSIKVSVADYFKALYPGILGCIIMAIAIHSVSPVICSLIFNSHGHLLMATMIKISIGLVFYISTLIVIEVDSRNKLLAYFKGKNV